MKKNELLNYELSERIRKGETNAFELLFKLYYKLLVNFAIVYVKNKEVSSEIVQETFIKIWELRTSIDTGKSLKAFLYRCVHNNCINYIKKAQINFRQSEEYFKETLYWLQLLESETTDTYFDKLSDEYRELTVQKAIDSLPQQCREVLILCRFENLSYNQTAEKLNISINTVKTQLRRAIIKLREALREQLTP